jgi:hypothetical protein
MFRDVVFIPTTGGGRAEMLMTTASGEGIHSTDLIHDIRKAAEGFFKFLDLVVRVASQRDAVLAIRAGTYQQEGLVPVLSDPNCLATIMPAIGEASLPADPQLPSHSSPA